MEDPTKARAQGAPPLEFGDGLAVAVEGDLVVLRQHGRVLAQDTAEAWRSVLRGGAR